MRRGDIITVALAGDYGKPRPALIVQSDYFAALPSLTVLPLTSELRDEYLLRLTIEPSRHNGLRQRSQIMIDKIVTVLRTKAGKRIGRMDGTAMREVDRAIARFLALA